MNRQRLVLTAALVLAVILASSWVIQARESGAPTGKNLAAVSSHPNFDTHPGPKGNPPRTVPRASTVLQWDDGSYETGLGVSGAAGYDGQLGMRFGGAANTTGLFPMRLRGASWRLFGGFYGAQALQLNFWHPLTPGGFPADADPLHKVPGPAPDPSTTQKMTFAGGPTISTPNLSVLMGIGVTGNSSWFIAADSTNPDNKRQFFGGFTTEAFTYGPATLTAFGFGWDFLIRLIVDGNIPVELESFTID